MSDPSLHTTQLNGWLERMRAGDLSARDELLRSVCGRLERLARKMLQRFPDVHRWADTGDVLQNAVLRLLRALEVVQPSSTRDFFGLAAEQMRRELLDLARHFNGKRGLGANHESWVQDNPSQAAVPDAPAPAASPVELEKWCRFHQEVERLPVEEREVVGLMFYHEWTQVEVAELLQINERTVRRRWLAALAKLKQVMQAEE